MHVGTVQSSSVPAPHLPNLWLNASSPAFGLRVSSNMAHQRTPLLVQAQLCPHRQHHLVRALFTSQIASRSILNTSPSAKQS